jgi:hypothetical protein
MSTRMYCANGVRELSGDPQCAFPGHGQVKPEQQEIDRLRKEVAKLKASATSKKTVTDHCPPAPGRNRPCYPGASEGSGRQLIGGTVPV